MIRLFAVAAIATCPLVLAAASSAEKAAALVVVGSVEVPLTVEYRFSDVAGALPKPGRMPVEDPHEKQHDSRVYCYRFGDELLEFFDSDFGVHTARLSRSPKAAETNCTALKVRPEFKVSGTRFSLAAKELPRLHGFTKTQRDQLVVLERSRTYNVDEKTCISHSVSVEAKASGAGFDSITVMNWEEPGC